MKKGSAIIQLVEIQCANDWGVLKLISFIHLVNNSDLNNL